MTRDVETACGHSCAQTAAPPRRHRTQAGHGGLLASSSVSEPGGRTLCCCFCLEPAAAQEGKAKATRAKILPPGPAFPLRPFLATLQRSTQPPAFNCISPFEQDPHGPAQDCTKGSISITRVQTTACPALKLLPAPPQGEGPWAAALPAPPQCPGSSNCSCCPSHHGYKSPEHPPRTTHLSANT